MATISITDVATHADVSVATVSRVMNQKGSVNAELRRRVQISCRELGFSPRRVTPCLAVITGRHSPALPVGYVSIVTNLVARFAAARGAVVEQIDVGNLDFCLEAHVDAVIGIVFDDRLNRLLSIPNLPIVSINKPMAEQGIHSFYADHYQQGLQATNHLIAHGHRQIGFLAIEPDEWGSTERRRGYRDALAASGLPSMPWHEQFTLEAPLYDILTRWKSRDISAMLNFSEDAGLETLHIISNVLGLRIGEDISTISLEDLPVYQYLNPPQTVVRQPLEELARLAVDRALELIENKNAAQDDVTNICLPTELVDRDSVASLAPSAQLLHDLH